MQTCPLSAQNKIYKPFVYGICFTTGNGVSTAREQLQCLRVMTLEVLKTQSTYGERNEDTNKQKRRKKKYTRKRCARKEKKKTQNHRTTRNSFRLASRASCPHYRYSQIHRHMPVEGSNSIFSSHTGHFSLRSYHSYMQPR